MRATCLRKNSRHGWQWGLRGSPLWGRIGLRQKRDSTPWSVCTPIREWPLIQSTGEALADTKEHIILLIFRLSPESSDLNIRKASGPRRLRSGVTEGKGQPLSFI